MNEYEAKAGGRQPFWMGKISDSVARGATWWKEERRLLFRRLLALSFPLARGSVSSSSPLLDGAGQKLCDQPSRESGLEYAVWQLSDQPTPRLSGLFSYL